MEMLWDWHCCVAFEQMGSKLPVHSTALICKICSATRMSWESSAKPSRRPPPRRLLHEHSDAEFQVHHRQPRRQSCAPSTNCSGCRRRTTGATRSTTLRWGTRSRRGHRRRRRPDATPDAGCQRKATDPAPPADFLNVQGALPLHFSHKEEKAELLRKVKRLREIAHLYNEGDQGVKEWFCKYIWSTSDVRK